VKGFGKEEEVLQLFEVIVKTVIKWGRMGKDVQIMCWSS
jgi:hypothetical protein